MNIFFDVDSTIIAYDGSLRPGVHEVFTSLKDQGHALFIWSGVGIRWEVVDRHKLRPYIEGCYWKPLYDHHRRLAAFGVPCTPDFCIDDHQEIIDAFGGVCVRAYDFPNRNDREMWRVHDIIAATPQAAHGE